MHQPYFFTLLIFHLFQDTDSSAPPAVCISIMVPSFKTKIPAPNNRLKKQRLLKIEKTIEKQLGITNRNEYEMFALVPINSKSCND